MSLLHSIEKTLCKTLPWNKARLRCMSDLIYGVLACRSVSLARICRHDTQEDDRGTKRLSVYRRFQRFFKSFKMPMQDVRRLIKLKIPRPEQGYILCMDRTNWKFGKKHINILTVGIRVNKVCVPLAWKVLPQTTKRGNSNARQRIALLRKVLKVLPANEIHALLMDREFHGKEWLEWLEQQGIGYVLRIKHNTIVGDRLANEYTARNKFAQPLAVWGLDLFFGLKAMPGKRGEKLYVVSNRFSAKEALGLYKKRWAIEQLFSHLKKRGFNLEDTHMSEAKKLEQLLVVVTMSFLFSYAWGIHLRTLEKQTAYEKRMSDFSYGLDSIEAMLLRPKRYRKLIKKFYQWFQSDQLTPNPQ